MDHLKFLSFPKDNLPDSSPNGVSFPKPINPLFFRHILIGFNNQQDVLNRVDELRKNLNIEDAHTNRYQLPIITFPDGSFGINIFKNCLDFLTEDEKSINRLITMQHTPSYKAYMPIVARYLDEKYVDQFFNEGILRLSSYRKCRMHEDKERGDKKEGINIVVGLSDNSSNSPVKVVAGITSGNRAYMLCASLKFDDNLKKDFSSNSGFIIDNSWEFMQAISLKVPEIGNLRYGPCIYTDNPLERVLPFFDGVEMPSKDMFEGTIDRIAVEQSIGSIAADDQFFRKDLMFSHQSEYRMIWETNLPESEEHLIIHVPEAVQFCRRFPDKPSEYFGMEF